MDFEDLFRTLTIVLICITAYFGLIVGWNHTYTGTVGSSVNNTYNAMQGTLNSTLFSLSVTSSNATAISSGPGNALTAAADLAGRALSIVTVLPIFVDLVPALFQDAANIVGIPDAYTNAISWMFLFSFAMTLMILLLLGTKRLIT